jgi:hypothetical protein
MTHIKKSRLRKQNMHLTVLTGSPKKVFIFLFDILVSHQRQTKNDFFKENKKVFHMEKNVEKP